MKVTLTMILTANEITQQLQINHDRKKLFVFDLDGTIIYNGNRLEHGFESVLCEIVAAGHDLYFATGRSYRDYRPMLPKWCHDLPAVVFGGGMVVNKNQVVHQRFLQSEKLAELVQFLEDHHVCYLIDGRNEYYHSVTESWILTDIIRISGQHPSHNLDNILADGAYKILILDSEWKNYCERFALEHDWELKFHSYNQCFDLMPKNVNKYDGLQYLDLPNSEDVFIFGNDHNDLELMQNFENNILFGECHELLPLAKVRIAYDEDLLANFEQVVNCILKKC